MFWAINKKLYEDTFQKTNSKKEALLKSKCLSVTIKEDYKFIFIDLKKGIIKPNYKEFYGYNRITRKVIKEQIWTFVNLYRKKSGIEINSYFTPSERGKKYVVYDPINDDSKHKLAQDILLTEFLDKRLIINYYDIPIQLNNLDYKKLEDVENYLEKEKKRKDLFEKGINFKETRKADMLIELNNFNSKFGFGFVFEIYNTESSKSIEEKRNDWTNMGYSYIPLNINQFNLSSEHIKKDRLLNVNDPFDKKIQVKLKEINTKENLLKNSFEQELENIRKISQTEINNLKNKLWEQENEFKNHYNDIKNICEELKDKKNIDLTDFEKAVDFKKRILNDLEIKKEQLVDIKLDTFSEKVEEYTNHIISEIEKELRKNKLFSVLDDIENITSLSNDFKNKLDKNIFTKCEENRVYCWNILKKKIDDYFEEKIKNDKSNSDKKNR